MHAPYGMANRAREWGPLVRLTIDRRAIRREIRIKEVTDVRLLSGSPQARDRLTRRAGWLIPQGRISLPGQPFLRHTSGPASPPHRLDRAQAARRRPAPRAGAGRPGAAPRPDPREPRCDPRGIAPGV